MRLPITLAPVRSNVSRAIHQSSTPFRTISVT